MHMMKSFLANEDGATAIEYGLIAALIAVSLIAGFGLMAGNLGNVLTGLSNKLNS